MLPNVDMQAVVLPEEMVCLASHLTAKMTSADFFHAHLFRTTPGRSSVPVSPHPVLTTLGMHSVSESWDDRSFND